METKWKDVAHLYLGCQVKCLEGNRHLLREASISTADIFTMTNAKFFNVTYWHQCFKPILRPLYDMTEDELKEAVFLNFGLSRDIVEQKISSVTVNNELKRIIKHGSGIPYNCFDENGNHVMSGTLTAESLNPQQFVYLLKQRFDLFGLIESSQAIYQTELTAPIGD